MRSRFLAIALCLGCYLALAHPVAQRWTPQVPKTWDEAALAEWATPLAGLNARPTHISAAEYYSLPVDNLRTYPAYFPGREPDGYWEILQKAGPKPLIEPDVLKTEGDWVEGGRRVFDEADFIHLRTYDPHCASADPAALVRLSFCLALSKMIGMNMREIAKALGRRGGQARARRLSAEERKRIASLGAEARQRSLQAAARVVDNFRYAAAVIELQGGSPAVTRMKAFKGPLPGIYSKRR